MRVYSRPRERTSPSDVFNVDDKLTMHAVADGRNLTFFTPEVKPIFKQTDVNTSSLSSNIQLQLAPSFLHGTE